MRAAVLEDDPRTGDQVFDCARRENLTGTGQSSNPRTDMDGHPADVVPHPLALTRVDTGSDLEAGLANTITDGDRAAHRAARPVSRRQESAAGRADPLPA